MAIVTSSQKDVAEGHNGIFDVTTPTDFMNESTFAPKLYFRRNSPFIARQPALFVTGDRYYTHLVESLSIWPISRLGVVERKP